MAETVNPCALVGADGARSCPARAGNPEKGHGRSSAATWFRIEDGDVPRKVALKERVRLTLLKLLAVDRPGVTLHDFSVGERLADYFWKLRAAYFSKLRAAGLPIESEMEAHEGAFSGAHARYRLAPGVRIRAEAGQ